MNLPNKITLIRIFLIPVFVALFLIEQIPYNYVWAGLVFIIASCTDFIDGYIARKYNLVTNLGKFLDPIADKVLVSTALILMLIKEEIFNPMGDWTLVVAGVCVAIILARELIISGFRQIAASSGTVMAADGFGKIKTTFQDISIACLLIGVDFFGITLLTTFIYSTGIVALGFATVLTIVSGVNYIVKNKQVFNNKEVSASEKIENKEEE